jgi:hypothetical protein
VSRSPGMSRYSALTRHRMAPREARSRRSCGRTSIAERMLIGPAVRSGSRERADSGCRAGSDIDPPSQRPGCSAFLRETKTSPTALTSCRARHVPVTRIHDTLRVV